jgi:hypothetical protein
MLVQIEVGELQEVSKISSRKLIPQVLCAGSLAYYHSKRFNDCRLRKIQAKVRQAPEKVGQEYPTPGNSLELRCRTDTDGHQ